MKFWIVTPSYNQLEWLKLCVASVADQASEDREGGAGCIEVHHHIQDALSSDGTPEWLAEHVAQKPPTMNYQLTFVSEADGGMYDAINRGWKCAPEGVDVIAHLNCDEQYLPGALQTIATFMSKHTKADVVLADMIVTDRDGMYICHRRSLKPYPIVSKYTCAGFTAATFQRSSVTKSKRVFFDTSWKNVGDMVWYNSLHSTNCSFRVCNEVVSLFTDTGDNLNWTDDGAREKQRYMNAFLRGSPFGSIAFSKLNGFRRWLKEFYTHAPSSYSIYVQGVGERVYREILHPTGLWHKKRAKLGSE